MRDGHPGSVQQPFHSGYRHSWHTRRHSTPPARVRLGLLARDRSRSPSESSGYGIVGEAPAELRQHVTRFFATICPVELLDALEPFFRGLGFIPLPYRARGG